MLINLRKLFTKGKSIGRLDFINITLWTIIACSLLIYLATIIPQNLLFYPFALFALLLVLVYILVFYCATYKRIKNIFNNNKITIPVFVLWLLSTISIIINSIFTLLLMFILGKKNTERVVSNKLYRLTFVLTIVLILALKFVGCARYMPNESMAFTIYPNDRVFINKLAKNYKRGDLVAHRNGKSIYLKRIVGLPGEKVEIKTEPDGASYVYINDEKLSETYVKDAKAHPECPTEKVDPTDVKIMKCAPIIVPENSYYLLGDNRENSYDSRYYGPVGKNLIKGRATHIIFPLKRRNVFKTPNYEAFKGIDNNEIAEYMKNMQKSIKEHWQPVELTQFETSTVSYRIHKDGKITNVKVRKSSGSKQLNRAAINTIKSIKKLPPLPKAIQTEKDYIEIDFDFNYGGK